MKGLLLSLIFPITLIAQESDILLLQKNNRTIRQFFAGTNISFITTDGMPVSAYINFIKNDSLFLLQHDVRMVPNYFGTYSPDTVAVYNLNFSLKNIGSFPARPRKFALITNGSLFMIGGAAYLLLNMINTIRVADPLFGKDNLPNLIGGVSTFAAGFLLNKTVVTEYKLGKKYKLKYLPVVTSGITSK
ncbi:MAG: hypothetical protein V4717_00855 [Bacteroidota bacterium]